SSKKGPQRSHFFSKNPSNPGGARHGQRVPRRREASARASGRAPPETPPEKPLLHPSCRTTWSDEGSARLSRRPPLLQHLLLPGPEPEQGGKRAASPESKGRCDEAARR